MRTIHILACIVFFIGAFLACGSQPEQAAPALRTRAEAIPAGAVKVSPATDAHPPMLHSDEFDQPVPLGSGVNSAGGEDSAFVLPDGSMIYFFFTPNVGIPAEKQLFDGVTGIWVSKKSAGTWQQAERVVLRDKNQLALDGAAFVQGNTMWFASARQGNLRGMDMWTATYRDGKWGGFTNAGEKLNLQYEIGEMHITADGKSMYFHSPRAGGQGGYDIWLTSMKDGQWQQPVNVTEVNSDGTDGWPFLTQDGNELWFTRTYMGTPAIYRTEKSGGKWGEPEMIVSQFAAEPSLDNNGNLYFTHHFFKDNKMIEADIYMAPRKAR
ncbi:MAG: hypothetical protein WC541_01660 [Dehalococcoidia bacterium]